MEKLLEIPNFKRAQTRVLHQQDSYISGEKQKLNSKSTSHRSPMNILRVDVLSSTSKQLTTMLLIHLMSLSHTTTFHKDYQLKTTYHIDTLITIKKVSPGTFTSREAMCQARLPPSTGGGIRDRNFTLSLYSKTHLN